MTNEIKLYEGKLGTYYGSTSAQKAYRALSHCRSREKMTISKDLIRHYVSLYIHIQKKFPNENLFLRWKQKENLTKHSLSIYPISILRSKAYRSASMSFRAQQIRCSDKYHKQYKHYGAKNISVKYSLHEFIEWWLKEAKSFKGKIPTVGRINHNENYCFSNIRMESKSNNSKERIYRKGGIKKTQPIFASSDSKSHAFSSCSEAARFFDVTSGKISYWSSNKLTKIGYQFERLS